MPLADHAAHLDLHSLHRGIDIAGGAAQSLFLAQHVPWLQRLPQFQFDIPLDDAAIMRETELEERQEPVALEGKTRLVQVVRHILEVFPDIVRQHEAVVDLRPPARQLPIFIGLLPEPRHQTAQQQHLHQAHPGVRRHLEGPHLHQAQPPGGGIR